MNKIILIGRLTADPELRFTPAGHAVCQFCLAVNRPFTSNNEERKADFIDIVVWNKLAENVAKYLMKGSQAAIDGRLQIRSYETNDGQKRWRTEVIASTVEFLGSKKASNDQDAQPSSGFSAPNATTQQPNGQQESNVSQQQFAQVPDFEQTFKSSDPALGNAGFSQDSDIFPDNAEIYFTDDDLPF